MEEEWLTLYTVYAKMFSLFFFQYPYAITKASSVYAIVIMHCCCDSFFLKHSCITDTMSSIALSQSTDDISK